ncbi:MAG: hypothetical protein AYK22_07875 [Thermoplasmatales archaeon SG8-52-3]|nr:MAG: hypothetical protein AYK22_07875 [Thermoplasmatales archaeon SG8-52-3]
MKIGKYKKGIVLAIVVLFFGASVIPNIGAENKKEFELKASNEPLVQPLFNGETYFIMLSNYSDSGTGNVWSVQMRFDSELEIVESEFDDATLPLIVDEWVEIKINIDLDTDWLEMYYDGDLLFEKNWTDEPSGGGGGILNIGAVDLFANAASTVYYDDISLSKVGEGVLWSEDFDSYDDGSSMHGQGGWKGWYNDSQYTANVTSAKSRSSPHSVDIANNSDLVHEYSGYTSGEYVYTAWMYIPENVAPYEPSDPDPSDGATDVSPLTNLSWTGGDPNDDNVTYNVFLEEGDSSPDILVSENQSGTSYDPDGLDFGTTYYWQIVAYDEKGLTNSGPVWSFSTRTNDAPYEPSDPSPADGSIDNEINVIVSWTGGDPDGDTVLYDVYFGTSSPPPMVVSNQSATSYNPGLLEFDTTYYWQIVSWDIFDFSATGSIWSFSTEENAPPYTPADPSPTDGETDVSIDEILRWTGGDPNVGDTVTYDVYFGKSSPPPLVDQDITQTAYDPGTMDLGTTYYWQIVSEDSQGATTTGPEWSFTTEEEPNEAPTAPDIDGPDTGKTGVELCWTFHSDDPNDHQVKYIIDWGDGDSEETALNDPCTPIEVCHTYEEDGTYIIKAYAEDQKGAKSGESTFEVTIPRGRFVIHPILLRFFEKNPNIFSLLRYIFGLF